MRRLVVPLLALPAFAAHGVFASTDNGTPLALEEMQITAPSEQADGPVDGYRATRSASATRTDNANPSRVATAGGCVLVALSRARFNPFRVSRCAP